VEGDRRDGLGRFRDGSHRAVDPRERKIRREKWIRRNWQRP
jgi:hypothetical protein